MFHHLVCMIAQVISQLQDILFRHSLLYLVGPKMLRCLWASKGNHEKEGSPEIGKKMGRKQ